MATLLLELFSEEIPSRMQEKAAENLALAFVDGLIDAGIPVHLHGKEGGADSVEIRSFVSPRHLAVQCSNLPAQQPDRAEEKRGPKVGAPEQAVQGFLQANGLILAQCETRAIGKDSYYFATLQHQGKPIAELLKSIAEQALHAFHWPKSMRWGARTLSWVRPLHRITCLLDAEIVPVTFAHLVASNVTQGHRFLAPGDIVIPHADAYESELRDAKVMVDFAARRAHIAGEIAALAKSQNLTVVPDEALLDEVTGLVEWPVALLGEFDKQFLDLPKEVLVSEMKVHQRYFALQNENAALSNRFIAVANITATDGGVRIIAGNQRVLRARLSDGAFYWEQDRKKPLAAWAEGLRDVVFHAKVGMVHEKVQRIENLAVAIAQQIHFSKDMALVRRAAQLCKADLTTGMVGEFPELQGIMGRYYALAQGENVVVADAIRDHYKPQGAGDSLPESDLAAILSIADKLDSIISLFAVGEKPTGSKDPLALRRAALGVLRILNSKELKLNLDLVPLIQPSARKDVIDFFKDRLKQLLKDQGYRHDVIDAVMPENAESFVSELIFAKARLLNDWLSTTAGIATLAAIKRSINILSAEEKKAKTTYMFDEKKCAVLKLLEETALIAVLKDTQAVAPRKAVEIERLTAPISAFFAAVLVTEEGKREARLSLLAGVRDVANQFADFAKLEG